VTRQLLGLPVRDAVFAELKRNVAGASRAPGLAVVLVGDDPASRVYVRNKEKGCEEVGFHHVTHRLPADAEVAAVLGVIAALNADPRLDGMENRYGRDDNRIGPGIPRESATEWTHR